MFHYQSQSKKINKKKIFDVKLKARAETAQTMAHSEKYMFVKKVARKLPENHETVRR